MEFQSQPQLLLPVAETVDGSEPESRYEFQPARKVATVACGCGNPRDAETTDIRKKLYEQVVKDGLKPKLDELGRLRFFFLQNITIKASYTEEGLGMCVYELRPAFAKANKVGIELQM